MGLVFVMAIYYLKCWKAFTYQKKKSVEKHDSIWYSQQCCLVAFKIWLGYGSWAGPMAVFISTATTGFTRVSGFWE